MQAASLVFGMAGEANPLMVQATTVTELCSSYYYCYWVDSEWKVAVRTRCGRIMPNLQFPPGLPGINSHTVTACRVSCSVCCIAQAATVAHILWSDSHLQYQSSYYYRIGCTGLHSTPLEGSMCTLYAKEGSCMLRRILYDEDGENQAVRDTVFPIHNFHTRMGSCHTDVCVRLILSIQAYSTHMHRI